LATRYYGPFPVLAKEGAISYKLKLPETTRVHSIFHVSQLKRAIGDYSTTLELPAELELEPGDLEELESILATRKIMKKGELIEQWLMRWKGRSAEETTWIDIVLLQSQFPHLRLEDKAIFGGGNNDSTLDEGLIQHEKDGEEGRVSGRAKIWKVYSRRKKTGPENIN